MRTISAGALAALGTSLGTEPIGMISVDWTGTGVYSDYADRTVVGVPGKIIDMSEMDNVIDISTGNSQQLTVKLDDVDGIIKAIMDTSDVHQRDVKVWQYFEGLDLTDRFLLFRGKVSSPIVWSEAERTVTFTVISQIEDREIGFSAEEGQFPYIPYSLVGKAWPIIFGTVLDVPALRVNQALKGTTVCGIGILSGADLHNKVPLGGDDCGSFFSQAAAVAQMQHMAFVADAYEAAGLAAEARQYRDQVTAQAAQLQIQALEQQLQQQCALAQRSQTITNANKCGLGCNPVTILGGEDFPQNKTIQLHIGSGVFTGTMRGNKFYISKRSEPAQEAAAHAKFKQIQSHQCSTDGPPPEAPILITPVPCGYGDNGGCYIETRTSAGCTQQVTQPPTAGQIARHTWIEPGASVSMASNEPITYIVSIIPGTVLAVKAFKTFQGPRKLVDVPPDLYTVKSVDYGDGIVAVEIVMKKPLSTVTNATTDKANPDPSKCDPIPDNTNQGWEDDIFVTFQSSVGPSMVDILEYIIDRWTDLDYDTTSFNHVKSLTDIFPMNFPILDRKNTIDVLKDIAFQGRCALWLDNGVFHLKYLPEEPDADDTFSKSDILANSLEVELTSTEELVTKMIAQWHLSWAFNDNNDQNDPKPLEIILRHNVNKYGVKEQTFDFYCYNQPDIVLKAATFWLIRKANTWKRIRFKAPLTKLALETFDTVQVPAGYVGTNATKAIVQTATYDSAANAISFECMTPIRSGEAEPYIFFWPKDVSDEFPTPEDIVNSGGVNTIKVLPIGNTDGIGKGGSIFVGGPNILFLQGSGRGDSHPGDVGFSAQTVVQSSVFANVSNASNPNPDLSLNYRGPRPHVKLLPIPVVHKPIDIRKTNITDSENRGEVSQLKSFIEKIKSSNMYIKGLINVSGTGDGGSNDATFEYKYDTDSGKFGAERAFLVDEDE